VDEDVFAEAQEEPPFSLHDEPEPPSPKPRPPTTARTLSESRTAATRRAILSQRTPAISTTPPRTQMTSGYSTRARTTAPKNRPADARVALEASQGRLPEIPDNLFEWPDSLKEARSWDRSRETIRPDREESGEGPHPGEDTNPEEDTNRKEDTDPEGPKEGPRP
jgi:hypothetical protein